VADVEGKDESGGKGRQTCSLCPHLKSWICPDTCQKLSNVFCEKINAYLYEKRESNFYVLKLNRFGERIDLNRESDNTTGALRTFTSIDYCPNTSSL